MHDWILPDLENHCGGAFPKKNATVALSFSVNCVGQPYEKGLFSCNFASKNFFAPVCSQDRSHMGLDGGINPLKISLVIKPN